MEIAYIRSLMVDQNSMSLFWVYVLLIAAVALDRVPSKAVKNTPYEIWIGWAQYVFIKDLDCCVCFE